MKDVLLAIDREEERAKIQAETVVDLFDTDNIQAHLFHVFTDNPSGASVTQVSSIRRAGDILEDAGVEVDYYEEGGDPAEEIVNWSEKLDVDCICIAGRKRSPTGKLVFGSVTQDVILNTERPVLTCGTFEMSQE